MARLKSKFYGEIEVYTVSEEELLQALNSSDTEEAEKQMITYESTAMLWESQKSNKNE